MSKNGAKLTSVVKFLEGRRHLPIVELKRAVLVKRVWAIQSRP